MLEDFVLRRNSPNFHTGVTQFSTSFTTVDPMKITILLSPFAVLMLALPLSAQERAVPDFSKGMPDAKLESKLEAHGEETFILTTALSSKEFSTTLSKFLGAGWAKRAINSEEKIPLAASSMGLTSIAEVNVAVYENAKIPGVDVEVMYVKYKEVNAVSRVTISVNWPGTLVRSFGSSMCPDGTKRLELTRRDRDLVDFEVLDSASGKQLASDSIGWSAMRWFLYWETSSKLWGYGSDIGYFKLFEFRPDGTVAESEVDEGKRVPPVVWDNLPSSLQRKYTADADPNPCPPPRFQSAMALQSLLVGFAVRYLASTHCTASAMT
ncbi:MAG: hypothetical protein KDN22_23330 [Verrucomicrobiae bacterium]|nr:hypothetical protein [Verrucomicrobiae bacterium]